jgi:uncharacterized protein (TIGR02145 family)
VNLNIYPWCCGQTFTDDRDNKTYPTVAIGTQCWMKNNLNYGNMIDPSHDQQKGDPPEKYCLNYDESKCSDYGGLYQWGEAVQFLNGASDNSRWNPSPTGYVQGICPVGWHVPSDAEWNALCSNLGDCSVAGGKMKLNTRPWEDPNAGATNSSGFTGLPAGTRYIGGTNYFGKAGYFWSTTDNSRTEAWKRTLSNASAGLSNNSSDKSSGYSVRCLKDDPSIH